MYALAQSLQQQGGSEAEVTALRNRFNQFDADIKRINLLMNGALDRDTRDVEGPSELGTLLLRVGQVQVGLHWLYTALERDPDHKPTHEALIAYYDKSNQPEKAKDHRARLDKINGTPPSPAP